MKRISIIAATLLFCITAANAYNPPVNGDGLFELSSARMLSTASSVTGGGLFNGNPSSVNHSTDQSDIQESISHLW